MTLIMILNLKSEYKNRIENILVVLSSDPTRLFRRIFSATCPPAQQRRGELTFSGRSSALMINTT
jgi:hypothetical protein